MTSINVVFAARAADVNPIRREAKIAAGQTILPGYLVEYNADQFRAHSTEGQGGDFFIADMNTIEQKNVRQALTAGDSNSAFVPEVGRMYALVLQDGQVADLGSGLTSNGDGTVKVAATDGTEAVLFSAEEALSPSGEDGRILARYNPGTVSADTIA